jgi:ribosomal protein S18 acetylase RimI-like enzyme
MGVITLERKSLVIRKTSLKDATGLQKNLFQNRTLSTVRDFLLKDLRMMDTGDMIRLVAETEGEIIGNIQIYFKFEHSLFHHTAEMHTVRVNENYRRIGVAIKLIEAALMLSNQKKVEIMTVWVDGNNIPATRLYQKMGFTEYGRLKNGIKRNGQYSDYVQLKKNLNQISQ